ncbi:MAG: hypothetical protein PHO52_13395 [Sulfuricurvum sp.]|uniref:hypothetical protein n=1 Tax=Sulfuricurvum sp. TaxID=2025608 RepID=UPI002630F93B|nr:hypothetical protein [Sulfuricurvum sp.]MDD2785198.1 hypothetical protein [Sulfuricurvum sp.]
MKEGISIEDVLNEEKEDVQTFKKAEQKAKLIKKAEATQKKAGRPAKTDDDVKKKRVLYYSDVEFLNIGLVAKKMNLSETEFMKSCVDFFMNLDELDEAVQIAKEYKTDLNSLLNMFVKREVKKEAL